MKFTVASIFILAIHLLYAQEVAVPNLDTLDHQKLFAIFEVDVFSYYEDQTSSYVTDLSKKVFKKTDEYKNLQATLEAIRAKLLSSRVTSSSYIMGIGPYDLKSGSFRYQTGKNHNSMFAELSNYQQSIGWFLDDNLPIKARTEPGLGDSDLKYFVLDLKCSEEDGLRIENIGIEKKNVVIEFQPVGVVSRTYTGYTADERYGITNRGKEKFSVTSKYIRVKDLVVKIVDEFGSEIMSFKFK